MTLAALAMVGCADGKHKSCTAEDRPNVIYILADDLGYGDVSFMGQSHFSTPNIDKLASDGVVFTRHYAGTSVSAPSRSSLLTGQHTGHTPIRGNKEVKPEGQHPLPANYFTIFRMLKDNGYTTGCFGKWGLGFPGSEGAPENQCVDEFYGYNCQRLAHNYYPYHLWHNADKVVLEGNTDHNENQYSAYLIQEQALKFIRDNKDRPFFLWYATTIPHAELCLPSPEVEPFIGKMGEETVYDGCIDGPNYKNGGYGHQDNPHAAFAAMITLLDKQVGEIVSLVEELGIADKTMIVFTSDNGPHKEGGADPNWFESSGGLRGTKRDLYEGGIREPFAAKWPGHIPAGSRTDHVSAFWDFLPTLAEITGCKIPKDAQIDGISYLPSLLCRGKQAEHEYLYWEFHEQNGRQAVLRGDWKAVRYNVSNNGKTQLYNLADDPGETKNLASQYPEMVAEFDKIMKEARTSSEVFTFASDAYNGDTKND